MDLDSDVDSALSELRKSADDFVSGPSYEGLLDVNGKSMLAWGLIYSDAVEGDDIGQYSDRFYSYSRRVLDTIDATDTDLWGAKTDSRVTLITNRAILSEKLISNGVAYVDGVLRNRSGGNGLDRQLSL